MHPAVLEIERYMRQALQQAFDEAFARVVVREKVDELLRQLAERRDSPAGAHRPQTTARGAALTSREREILERIAEGDSNKAIARTFGLSVHTVKRHVANILAKIGVSSRVQAAMWLAANH